MVEISKRKIEMDSIFPMYDSFQVSINDYGNIVLRWFNKPQNPEAYPYEPGKDIKAKKESIDFIIVLTKDETEQLIQFIRKITRIDC
jgi:hypothetical protein